MNFGEYMVEYLILFLENFSFFYIVFRKKFRKLSNRTVRLLLICYILIGAAGAGLQTEMESVWFLGAQLLTYGMLYLMFRVSLAEMIGLALEQGLLLSIIEMALYVCEDWFAKMLSETLSSVVIMCVILLFLWAYYFLFGKKADRQLFQLPIRVLYLLDGIMLILAGMMSFFSYVVVIELPEGGARLMGRLFVLLGGALLCVLLLAMMYYYNRTQSFRAQKEFAQMQGEQQREYFRQMLEREEETKSFRHDIINDLLELKNYCEQKEYGKLEEYLKNTLGVIEGISRKNYDVGSDIINTVLHYYLKPVCSDYKVTVNGYVKEALPIDERDLCVVTSNLIKNAVEAVKKQEQGSILFELKTGKHYLSVLVKNTYEGTLKIGKDGMPRTTNPDAAHHGFGLHAVKNVAEKYEGKCFVKVQDGMYQIEVFLKLW